VNFWKGLYFPNDSLKSRVSSLSRFSRPAAESRNGLALLLRSGLAKLMTEAVIGYWRKQQIPTTAKSHEKGAAC
jgi:hypothetical protein